MGHVFSPEVQYNKDMANYSFKYHLSSAYWDYALFLCISVSTDDYTILLQLVFTLVKN